MRSSSFIRSSVPVEHQGKQEETLKWSGEVCRHRLEHQFLEGVGHGQRQDVATLVLSKVASVGGDLKKAFECDKDSHRACGGWSKPQA